MNRVLGPETSINKDSLSPFSSGVQAEMVREVFALCDATETLTEAVLFPLCL